MFGSEVERGHDTAGEEMEEGDDGSRSEDAGNWDGEMGSLRMGLG